MELTHFDNNGNASMVDVGGKKATDREAVAKGRIKVSKEVFAAVKEGTAKKGDVLGVARIAGIMGAKNTAGIIPLCHALNLARVSIDFQLFEEQLEIEAVCSAKTVGQTGVEMEALMGTSTALLTIYDMCKAIDKTMELGGIHLVQKTGGKSGTYISKRK